MNDLIRYSADIKKQAKRFDIPERDLQLKATIVFKQLNGVSIVDDIRKKITSLAEAMAKDRADTKKKYYVQAVKHLDTSKCRIAPLHWREAKDILEKYHYLGAYRNQSLHLGLYYQLSFRSEKLVGVITFSQFDLAVKPYSVFSLFKPSEILLLSRLYTFEWAPYNTSSYFMSQALRFIKTKFPRIQCVLTVANPNVGHTGSSYKASNWLEIGQFSGSPYLFLSGRPVTMRSLAEKYHTLSLKKLKVILGRKLYVSRERLLPQKIFMYILNSRTKKKFYSKGLDRLYFFDGYDFMPEYGITTYDETRAISFSDAKKAVKRMGNKIIAGYLEKAGAKKFSSVIIHVNNRFTNIRKEKRWREEVIDDSNEPPRVVNLPLFGKALVMICYDVHRYARDKNLIMKLPRGRVKSFIIISYWRNNFHLLLESINTIADAIQAERVLCLDYFHGFHLIKY